jgi:hypothetical protein
MTCTRCDDLTLQINCCERGCKLTVVRKKYDFHQKQRCGMGYNSRSLEAKKRLAPVVKRMIEMVLIGIRMAAITGCILPCTANPTPTTL